MLELEYEKKEDIPAGFEGLYSERGGKWVLTGIKGMKTQTDIDRLQTSLTAERNDHVATKEKLAAWGDLDPTETLPKLDKIPELEAAAAGKLDEAQIEEMVNRRVEATINTRLAPVQRELDTVTKDRDTLKTSNDELTANERRRTIHDAVRQDATMLKVIPEAMDDVLMNADRVFEVNEHGEVRTRDNVGVTPGVTAEIWLRDLQDKRRFWWPASQGGGASGGGSGGGGNDPNPWTHKDWSLDAQTAIRRGPNGAQRAEELAKAAGSVGGRRPAPEK